MNDVLFWFVYFAERDDLETGSGRHGPHGPRFTRWLPNGESDAIGIATGELGATLKIWLERHLKQDVDIKIYDYVDARFANIIHSTRLPTDNEIACQARFEGGPIYGQLALSNMEQSLRDQLSDGRVEPILEKPDIVKLGKRVVEIIYNCLTKFLSVLRYCYGQYWLALPQKWDSKRQTLGEYCSQLQLQWKINSADSKWADFQPTDNGMNWVIHTDDDEAFYGQYLTKDEWYALPSLMTTSSVTSGNAMEIASICHEMTDQGKYKYAILEGATALEIAIGEYVSDTCDAGILAIISKDTKWRDLAKPVKTALIGSLVGADKMIIRDAIEIINIRNEIVHEGRRSFPEGIQAKLKSTVALIALLSAGRIRKLPSASVRNRIDTISP